MVRKTFRGNQGLKKGDAAIPGVLGKIIALLTPLPGPTRLKILRGLNVWLLEDMCPNTGDDDERGY